jgi:hypothetical protein
VRRSCSHRCLLSECPCRYRQLILLVVNSVNGRKNRIIQFMKAEARPAPGEKKLFTPLPSVGTSLEVQAVDSTGGLQCKCAQDLNHGVHEG